ncbi:DUF805 domain-containing protein [Pseudoxanthobacter soli]|nr:DUF805 domain-containing protein [Pseudoxanthobacter soli]
MSIRSLFFRFDGRICRKDFWIGHIAVDVVMAALGAALVFGNAGIAASVGVAPSFELGVAGNVIVSVLMLVAVVAGFAVAIKRLHDRNRSGWFILVFSIPGFAQGLNPVLPPAAANAIHTVLSVVFGVWYYVELGFLRGTVGDNRFGPDPLGDAR